MSKKKGGPIPAFGEGKGRKSDFWDYEYPAYRIKYPDRTQFFPMDGSSGGGALMTSPPGIDIASNPSLTPSLLAPEFTPLLSQHRMPTRNVRRRSSLTRGTGSWMRSSASLQQEFTTYPNTSLSHTSQEPSIQTHYSGNPFASFPVPEPSPNPQMMGEFGIPTMVFKRGQGIPNHVEVGVQTRGQVKSMIFPDEGAQEEVKDHDQRAQEDEKGMRRGSEGDNAEDPGSQIDVLNRELSKLLMEEPKNDSEGSPEGMMGDRPITSADKIAAWCPGGGQTQVQNWSSLQTFANSSGYDPMTSPPSNPSQTTSNNSPKFMQNQYSTKLHRAPARKFRGPSTDELLKYRPAWDSTVRDLTRHKLHPIQVEQRRLDRMSKNLPKARADLELKPAYCSAKNKPKVSCLKGSKMSPESVQERIDCQLGMLGDEPRDMLQNVSGVNPNPQLFSYLEHSRLPS